jgi:ABC-type nitrate/sulfonate/bicarbonate transport system ATPase subunit
MTAPARDTEVAAEPLIEVRGAGVAYGDLRAFTGIDLAVRPGEIVSVVGPSGCGKTTLLRAIQRLTPVTEGSVTVRSERDGAPPEIGYVFQQPTLLPWASVYRNVEFGLRLRARRERLDAARRRERVARLLDLVGLAEFAEYRPAALSGGMRQRVNLARALAVDPTVLLLDEPFSAVDTLTRERLQRVLAETLHTLGTTAILVTHDIREAVFLGDRVIVLRARPGTVVADVRVDAPHPRTDAYQHGPEISRRARHIYELLREHETGEPRP